MRSRGRIELTASTVAFIGISGTVSMARGHPPGVVVLLLLAPLLAALVTLVASVTFPSPPDRFGRTGFGRTGFGRASEPASARGDA